MQTIGFSGCGSFEPTGKCRSGSSCSAEDSQERSTSHASICFWFERESTDVHTQEGFEQLRPGTQFSHPHQFPTASCASFPPASLCQPLRCTGVGWPGLSQPRPLQAQAAGGMEQSSSRRHCFSSNIRNAGTGLSCLLLAAAAPLLGWSKAEAAHPQGIFLLR